MKQLKSLLIFILSTTIVVQSFKHDVVTVNADVDHVDHFSENKTLTFLDPEMSDYQVNAIFAEITDLIIAVGNQLEFLTNGTEYTKFNLKSYNASKLSALAYDPESHKLFFADKRHSRGHIFSLNLNNNQSVVQDIVERSSNETVESLTYDPVEKMLLWTDGLKRSIRRIRIDQVHAPENTTIELVHFLEKDDKPRGLVSDPCNRMLYWTNRYMARPTIERSHLNGSGRELIIQTNLLLPHALDLDVLEQRLYWADNLRNGYFHIERSFVNGTGRQLIYRGIGQFVVSLTVGQDYVYWSDYDHKTVWSLRKDGSAEKPDLLRQYLQSPPMAIVIFHHQPLDCSLVPSLKTYPTSSDEMIASTNPEMDEQLPHDNGQLCLGFCYNQGQCIITDSDINCSCPPGFSGERCELTVQRSCYALVGEISQAETLALIGLSITCVLLMALVIILTLRLRKLTGNKMRFKRIKRRCLPVNNSNSSTSLVQDVENCCNSILMCERPVCPQQSKGGKGKTWKSENDGADLLRNEF